MGDGGGLMQEVNMTQNSRFSFKRLPSRTRLPTTSASHMRGFLPVLLAMTVAGCRCAPATPTPVTLRIKNASRDPVIVQNTKGQLGLSVQRSVNGQWFSFDDLPCVCQTCDRICDRSCRCPDAGITGTVRNVPPNGQAERTWDGVVQVAGSSCDVCLIPENAPPDETFQLRLCYVTQLDGIDVPSDGGSASGDLPVGDAQTCTTRTFQPDQGVVEIGPDKGADCTSTAGCKGQNELCLAGSCTAGCPANTFPAQAELFVTSASMGFFDETREADGGRVLLDGVGRITAAQFVGETLQLSLNGANGTGRVDVKLPGGLGAPSFAANTDAGVLVVTRTIDGRTSRGVVVRDPSTNEVLFAADSALNGMTLKPSELAPFSVATQPEAVGCRFDAACGKFTFLAQTLTNAGASVTAAPGTLASLSTSNTRFWNVTAGQYPASSRCVSYRPFAFWKER